jgi:hypothetical protein
MYDEVLFWWFGERGECGRQRVVVVVDGDGRVEGELQSYSGAQTSRCQAPQGT